LAGSPNKFTFSSIPIILDRPVFINQVVDIGNNKNSKKDFFLSNKIILMSTGDDMKPPNRVIWIMALIAFFSIAGCSRDKGEGDSSSGTAVSGRDNIPPTPGKRVSVKESGLKTIVVSWDTSSDNETPEKDLQYKLIYSKKNNISTIESAEKYGTVVMGWTPGSLSRQVKGLSTADTYYFTVLVRDRAGNIAVYMPQALSTVDSTPPVAKGPVVVSNISKDSLMVSWPPAIDDVTSQEKLQYKLLYTPPNNIRMIANAENSGTLIMDWTVNVKSRQVNDLALMSSYYFVVMVKDEAGNKTMYPPQKGTVPDASAPGLGANAPSAESGVTVSDITSDSATVSWGTANDDAASNEKLQYKVVYSTSRNIDNVNDANANGQVALGWTANVSSHRISGLEPSTTYYITTLVKDEAGNETLYGSREVTTLPR
jgi:hypothetical protein